MKGSRRDILKAALGVASASFLPRARAQSFSINCQPYLQNVRPDRATLLWAAQEPGEGAVIFSPDRTYSQIAPARVREFLPSETRLRWPHYLYSADLYGLTPGVDYYYRILLDGQDLLPGSDDLTFRTATRGPFSFLAFGDSGQATEEQRQLSRMMRRERASLVLHTGDMAYYSGTFEQFQNDYFAAYSDLMRRMPFYPALGNHEYETPSAGPALAVHAPPVEDVPLADRGRYYSFDWGNVHFVSVDSNDALVAAVQGSGRMFEWLENDLSRTQRFWKIVFFHHPPYASGPNENDPLSRLAREHLVPILERHGVQLVLNGHEHSYQQSKPLLGGDVVEPGRGTLYVTTGGGGASLYSVYPRPFLNFGESAHHYLRADVQGSRTAIRVIRVDGQEIDNFVVAPAPALSSSPVVNAASFQRSVAPGSLISVFGRNLAPDDAPATAVPLPTEMSDLSVTVNGRRIPLLFVSPTQVNAQLPFDVLGDAALRVTTANGSTETNIRIEETAPALFPAASAAHADGRPVTPAQPAAPGETILLFLTGLGRVNGEAIAGRAASATDLLRIRARVEVQIGIASVAPSFAGLAPGYVGLYQINVRVPPSLPAGSHPLRVIAGGTASNEITLPVG